MTNVLGVMMPAEPGDANIWRAYDQPTDDRLFPLRSVTFRSRCHTVMVAQTLHPHGLRASIECGEYSGLLSYWAAPHLMRGHRMKRRELGGAVGPRDRGLDDAVSATTCRFVLCRRRARLSPPRRP